MHTTSVGDFTPSKAATQPARITEVSDWASTYEASYRTLLRVAYSLTGSSAAAEDAVHDAFCSVGPKISELDDPVPYLRVAVVNRCRTMHARSQRADALRIIARPETERLDTGLAEFGDALDRLTFPQRTAIVLRYLSGLDDIEIAQALDCRRSTVRSHIRRAIAQLRTELAQPDDTGTVTATVTETSSAPRTQGPTQ